MTVRKRKAKPPASMPAAMMLRLDPDMTLKVQLLEPPKMAAPPGKWLRVVVWGVIVAAILYGILASLYVWPHTYISPTEFDGTPALSISLSYPTYVAYGDIAEIFMTISNLSDTTITGTMVFTFTEMVPVQTLPSKRSAITLTALKSGERLTERLSILLNRPLWFRDENVHFQVSAEMNRSRRVLPHKLVIRTAPIPYLSTIFAWLPAGSILLNGLLAFIWEVFKGRLARK